TADAGGPTEAGLRRALLAGWARELGLKAPAHRVVRGAVADQAIRLAEDVALERLMLEHAERLLNDGPSAREALASELQLRGLTGKNRHRPRPRGSICRRPAAVRLSRA